jgi:hypothetical protein
MNWTVSDFKIIVGVALALVVLCLVGSPASAVVVSASGSMSVDGGDPIAIPVTFSPEFGVYGIGSWDALNEQFTGFSISSAGEYDIGVSGMLDPDPQISWGVTVTDFGAPSNFNFLFNTPIAVGPGPTTVNASVSGGITDSNNNGVTITPNLADSDLDTFSELAVATLDGATNMGVDVGLAQSAGPPSGAYSYGAYGAGPQPGPAGPFSTLSVTVGFGLSGGGDIASLTGFAQIVPEPGSVVLFVMGLLGLGLFAHRRRR